MSAAPAFPWLAHYPEMVPHTIDEQSLQVLPKMLEDVARLYGSRPAYTSFGKTLTFDEITGAARAVGAWLQAQGHKKGDRIALMMPNVMAYPAALFGVLHAGLTVVKDRCPMVEIPRLGLRR